MRVREKWWRAKIERERGEMILTMFAPARVSFST